MKSENAAPLPALGAKTATSAPATSASEAATVSVPVEVLREIAANVATMSAELKDLRNEVRSLRAATPSRCVSVKEAAQILGVHPNTIRNRIDDGSIPFKRVGARILVEIDRIGEVDEARVASFTRSLLSK